MNNEQCVIINNKKMCLFYIVNTGNTQESILGPKLLSLDRNSPPESHQRARLILYADNTCVYTCGTSATGVFQHWTGVWHQCTWRQWLDGLNIQVPHFLLKKQSVSVCFSSGKPPTSTKSSTNNASTEQVSEVRYLGSVLDPG